MTVNRRDVLLKGGATAAALATTAAAQPAAAQAMQWHHTADVVVIGSGASGLPAAIVAKEAGSSVIVVEAQPHVGGHARCSGGNLPLGGGHSVQKKYGIEDSPDLVFKDLTDWSVVQPNGFPDYRYNDHEIIRAFADNSAATSSSCSRTASCSSTGRRTAAAAPRSATRCCARCIARPMDWPLIQTGAPANPNNRATMSTGNGLMQPLDAAARQKSASSICSSTR